MLLTGRWPCQTGIVDNALDLRSDEVSLGHMFHNAGYRTGYIGKGHLSAGDEGGRFIPNGPACQGFDYWQVWARTNQHFDSSFTFDPETGARIQPKGYNCTLMTDQAEDFIGANGGRPWMLMLSWNPPHPNFGDAPVIFEPLEFTGKLAALVPPPRFHEVRYYGILAPAAAWRSLVVPESEAQDLLPHAGCPAKNDAPAQTGNRKGKGRRRPRNYTWAELIKRVFLVDVLVCDRCGGRMKVLCAVHPPAAIRKILTCLGLPSRPPPIAHASPAFDDPYIS
jgi:hypothetical protein